MASRPADGVLHRLTRLVEAQSGQQTDGQLLRRFATSRDEGAFAVLVHRHGSLVYGVCRNILRHEHDAEDAFQATFMVLARRAGVIREGQALGSWLYRVAYRVSMKARSAADRRRRREDQAARPAEDRPTGELAWRELQAMLDEELNRLPAKYQAPFVLCCLTGKSKAEAAAELRWKEGTVSSRLARARELLQGRLARRGVTLSAVLSGLAISQNGSAIAVPVGLLAQTQEASLAFVARQTAMGGPVALARSVLWQMTMRRFAIAGTALIVLCLAGTTAFVVLDRPSAPEAPPAPPLREVAVAAPLAPGDAPPEPEPEPRMTMTGLVLDRFGKNPFPGANVAVIVSPPPRADDVYAPGGYGLNLLGEKRTDANGQYELSVAQTTHGHRLLKVWASAPGHAPFVRLVEPQAITKSRHEFQGDHGFQMIPGQTVRGRLLDPDGKPAKKVPVLILGMLNQDGPIRINVVSNDPPTHLPGWPKDIVTDDEGIFTVRDIGPNTKVLLQVRDERYATNWYSIKAGTKGQAKPVDLTLLPPRTLTGRLTAQDTGKPLANADVVVETMMPYPNPSYGAFPGCVTAKTDEKGEFRVRPFPGERVEAYIYPPSSGPYLPVRRYLKWPAGKGEHSFEMAVSRGIQVRGKVEEKGTDRPVAGAAVTFQWGYQNNPYRLPASDRDGIEWRHRDAITDDDGKFTITVPPGPGLLLVKSGPDFVRVETSSEQAEGGKGGKPYFPNAFVPLQLKPTDVPPDMTLQLRRGVAFRGQVVSSDGSPVKSALVFTPKFIPSGLEYKGQPLVVRNGRFELLGCEPDGKVGLWVYDPDKKEGGFAEFDVGAGGEPVIRLAPCVSGGVRVMDAAGKPVRGAQLSLYLVLRPGDDVRTSVAKGTLAGIGVSDTALYKYDRQPADRGDGTFPLKDLIPGAQYIARAMTAASWSDYKPFTVPKSGDHDLGTLVLDPPAARKGVGSPPAPGRPYIYQPQVVDPDGDPFVIDLVQGPDGMSFDPQTGVLHWVPSEKQVGKHPVVLRASDPYGASAIQKWEINVAEAAPPPKKRKD